MVFKWRAHKKWDSAIKYYLDHEENETPMGYHSFGGFGQLVVLSSVDVHQGFKVVAVAVYNKERWRFSALNFTLSENLDRKQSLVEIFTEVPKAIHKYWVERYGDIPPTDELKLSIQPRWNILNEYVPRLIEAGWEFDMHTPEDAKYLPLIAPFPTE